MNLNRKDHTNAVIESLLAAKIAVFKVEMSDDIGEGDTIFLANGYSLGIDYGSVASHGLVRVDLDRDVGGRKSDTLDSWEMPPVTHSMLVSAISHEFKGRVNQDEAWLLAKNTGYQPEYGRVMAEPSTFALWVVYDSPIDLPDRFVARKWINETPTTELLQGKTLDELRSRLPGGLCRLDRFETDDPKIVETWI